MADECGAARRRAGAAGTGPGGVRPGVRGSTPVRSRAVGPRLRRRAAGGAAAPGGPADRRALRGAVQRAPPASSLAPPGCSTYTSPPTARPRSPAAPAAPRASLGGCSAGCATLPMSPACWRSTRPPPTARSTGGREISREISRRRKSPKGRFPRPSGSAGEGRHGLQRAVEGLALLVLQRNLSNKSELSDLEI